MLRLKSFGRTAHYYCLVILIYLVYTPDFVIDFIYFATVIHQEDRVLRHKYVNVRTSMGRRHIHDV